MQTPVAVTFVLIPRFNQHTIGALVEVMRVANYLSTAPLFRWQFVAPGAGPVLGSNDLPIETQPLPARLGREDLVFVAGSWGAEHYAPKPLLDWLRLQSRSGARLCAVELGCYPLARAGLLGRSPIAVHWAWQPGFNEHFPEHPLHPGLFNIQAPVMSCAGGTAGVDMMLALLAQWFGARLASEVADQMLYTAQRPGDAAQRQWAAPLASQTPNAVAAAITLIETHVSDPLTVPQIAAELGLSQRALERQFKAVIGCSLVQFSQLYRLQHARVLLTATTLGVREIATAAGFNSQSHFTQIFSRQFGRPPSQYRQSWPAGQTSPSWPGTLADYLATRKTPE